MRALLLLVLLLARPQLAGAQVVHDDFSAARLSPQNWFICRRPENVISVIDWPGVGRAVRLVARPLGQKVLGADDPVDERHSGCFDRNGKLLNPDKDQRAEIWERETLKEPFGTETWIQFDFMVDSPPPGAEVLRLVVGQLKADNDRSPVLAQRFNGRHFIVTLSQDNEEPGRNPKDEDCRVLVAHDASLREPLPGSLGVDRRGVVHGKASPPGTRGCKRDLVVEAKEMLPSPYDRWVRMTYRIKPGIADGRLEVWADGVLIAKAQGRIGYRANVAGKQYFKFGPYGHPAPYDLKAWLARYRRAPTCAQLGDPAAAECR